MRKIVEYCDICKRLVEEKEISYVCCIKSGGYGFDEELVCSECALLSLVDITKQIEKKLQAQISAAKAAGDIATAQALANIQAYHVRMNKRTE
jgi:hypothetical protein